MTVYMRHNHYAITEGSNCCTAAGKKSYENYLRSRRIPFSLPIPGSCTLDCNYGWHDGEHRSIMSYVKSNLCSPLQNAVKGYPKRVPVYSGYKWKGKVMGQRGGAFCAWNRATFEKNFDRAATIARSAGSSCQSYSCSTAGCFCKDDKVPVPPKPTAPPATKPPTVIGGCLSGPGRVPRQGRIQVLAEPTNPLRVTLIEPLRFVDTRCGPPINAKSFITYNSFFS
jgi:hypothetical protein